MVSKPGSSPKCFPFNSPLGVVDSPTLFASADTVNESEIKKFQSLTQDLNVEKLDNKENDENKKPALSLNDEFSKEVVIRSPPAQTNEEHVTEEELVTEKKLVGDADASKFKDDEDDNLSDQVPAQGNTRPQRDRKPTDFFTFGAPAPSKTAPVGRPPNNMKWVNGKFAEKKRGRPKKS